MSSQDNRRKILAVLSGGLVLGVGAAVVLAAWNDSEFASGTFTAGQFNLQGSTTNATDGFADHDAQGAAASLDFTLPLAANLSPGDVVYAPFWVRLDEATTTNATVEATGIVASSGNNAVNLSYAIYDIDPAAACDATAADADALATGTTLAVDTGVASDQFNLTAGADAAAGEAVQLCFVITAGDDLLQGEEAVATWQFEATSAN